MQAHLQMKPYIQFLKTHIPGTKKTNKEIPNSESIIKSYYKYKDIFNTFTFKLGKQSFEDEDTEKQEVRGDVASLGFPWMVVNFDVNTDIPFVCFHLAQIIHRLFHPEDAYLPGMSILLTQLLNDGYDKEALFMLAVAGGPGAIEKYIDEDYSPIQTRYMVDRHPDQFRKLEQKYYEAIDELEEMLILL